MKAKYILVTILLFCSNIAGYSQHSFPAFSDNAKWNVLECFYGIGYFCNTTTYQYQSDTSFCGYSYSKINIGFNEGGFIRSDNNHTYYRKTINCSDKEYTMYDYTKDVGDTLYVGFKSWGPPDIDTTAFIVKSIDAININGIHRRVFHMLYNPYPNIDNSISTPMDWIEGIGSTLHPFYSLTCIQGECENSLRLLCYDSLGIQLYSDSTFNTCDTTYSDAPNQVPQYISMINDSIYWDIFYAEMGYFCDTYYGGGNRYFLGNDTIINGLKCTNIKAYKLTSKFHPQVECPPHYVDTIAFNTGYYLREDSGRIYLDNSLLFDYNCKVGDSIDFNYMTFKVDTIYNVTTADGVVRRMYECNTGNTGYFLEGIGGPAGILNIPFYYFEQGYWLSCWGYFNNNLNHCSDFITDATNLNQKNNNFVVYPNPASSNLTIEIKSPARIELSNINGQILFSQMNNQTTQIIDLSNYSKGIYLLKLTGNYFSETRKIIKQ